MLQLIPLEKIESLESLETTLKPLNERDRRKHYSNLELICNSMNLIYQSHLKLELIAQKRNEATLTAEEHLKLSIEANQQTKKAHEYLSTLEKDCIYWNDEDIEHEFKCCMLQDVNEC
ncbi:hypothetical protein [Poseidonibacter ostreae]|uniref:Uncharacterized protein n=1 Tax=Poseidonibacter ostreae TaxID=2654171 RepID=A0ABQ6VS53_9BACT|nr:hypothetical protein [Poseidonibacter ostreae]KAB7891556.1 hypothetical protein GBG18_06755 [Poseidonibacter ostreae]